MITTLRGLIVLLVFGAGLVQASGELTELRNLSEAALESDSTAFNEVVRATTGFEILRYDAGNPDHRKLGAAMANAADLVVSNLDSQPILAARPNEAGSQLDRHVKAALEQAGLQPRTPHNSEGRAQSTGYPDIELPGIPHCYLELKSYNASTLTSSQRTFYYSPSETPKVTTNALHLLLAFELTREPADNGQLFRATRWELISLESLEVRMKLEFNQSNRGLYGPNASTTVIDRSRE